MDFVANNWDTIITLINTIGLVLLNSRTKKVR